MERQEKFTPGPWRFWRHVNEKYPEWSQTAVFGTGDKKFVMIAQTHDDLAAAPEQTIEEIIANAHLIAAAPDMYEMLEHIEDALDDSSGCGEISVEKIRKLLKKARGEE